MNLGSKKNILVINAGSSSVKFALFRLVNHDFENNVPIVHGVAEKIGNKDSFLFHKVFKSDSSTGPLFDEKTVSILFKDHDSAILSILDLIAKNFSDLSDVVAIGHRVVHGGEFFNKSVLIDAAVMASIKRCAVLAPLHNPHNLAGILACKKVLPDTPMIAVFDTAFHQTLDKSAFMYPIPYHLYQNHGIRRYGFHGTSHHYVAIEASKKLNKSLDKLKLISLHLGNGSSACAIKFGKSIDTSMGFTPLEGLMMGTRSGSIDPAIVLFLQSELGMSVSEVDSLLNKKSGLLGVSELSNDVRDLRKNHSEKVDLALNMFVHSVVKYIGAYYVLLEGCDAIIFTAGIGQNVALIREMIVSKLKGLNIFLDLKANEENNSIISSNTSSIQVLVIPTNEELMIAKETLLLI